VTQRQELNAGELVAYARGLRGWYGSAAVSYARNRAKELRGNGDDRGHDTWLQLAAMLKAAESKRANSQ
jgi:hypothetical protein